MFMYGCGLRRSETANLRIQYFNVDTGMLSVQFGTGGTSRTVPLPHKIHGDIIRQFEQVRALHQADLKRGYDGVFLPASFAQKAKSAARELVWQWFFPAQRLTFVEATREVRRYHVHASDIQRAIKAAARKAGIPKRVSPRRVSRLGRPCAHADHRCLPGPAIPHDRRHRHLDAHAESDAGLPP